MMKNIRVILRPIMLLPLLLWLGLPKASATIYLNDGETHNINSELNDNVWVDYEAPDTGTTVNWLDGAISQYKLNAYENSHINFSGGSIIGSGDLNAYDNSHINFSKGSIQANLFAWGNSSVVFTGGFIDDLYAYENSQISIASGEVGDDLSADHNCQISISGGVIGGDMIALRESRTYISGGVIQGELILDNDSIVTISASSFTIDGQLVAYGELTSVYNDSPWNDPLRYLSCTFANGESLDCAFRIGENAKILLIPEPGTVFLLVLGTVLFRRRT